MAGYRPTEASTDRRSQAIQQLRKIHSPYTEVACLRRFRKGEKGTTFPWANTSTALVQLVGRCWLVSEIAVIGAASPLRDGYSRTPGTDGLGSDGQPATLIAHARANQTNAEWWRERLTACHDELAKAEWALAVWGVAHGSVVDELCGEFATVIKQLTPRLRRSWGIAARRLVQSGFVIRRIDPTYDVGALLAPMHRGQIAQSGATYGPEPTFASSADSNSKPLATVARKAKWLEVDQIATYR